MGVYQAQQDSKQTAIQMVLDEEVDIILIVGDDSLALLPGIFAKSMLRIPIIYIGPPGAMTAKKARISIPTIENGIATSGTMRRMDLKEVELNPIKSVKIELSSELEMVRKLHQFVKMQMKKSS